MEKKYIMATIKGIITTMLILEEVDAVILKNRNGLLLFRNHATKIECREITLLEADELLTGVPVTTVDNAKGIPKHFILDRIPQNVAARIIEDWAKQPEFLIFK